MDNSGEVADLMVKESIQITEAAVKLLAGGGKNLAAFLLALSQNNKKLCGKANMSQLIQLGRELRTICRTSGPTQRKMYCFPPSRTRALTVESCLLSRMWTMCLWSITTWSSGAIPPPYRSRRPKRQKKPPPALGQSAPHHSAGMAQQPGR